MRKFANSLNERLIHQEGSASMHNQIYGFNLKLAFLSQLLTIVAKTQQHFFLLTDHSTWLRKTKTASEDAVFTITL